MKYSSTSLERPARSGCWKQLDYAMHESDQSLFKLRYRTDLGIAAHAVIQYVYERQAVTEPDIRKTAEEVASTLIAKGRVFRGVQSGPLPANEVYAGVEIAVSYLLANPPDYFGEIIVERECEHPTIPYTALIDLLTIAEEGDEESAHIVATACDWKTSWRADAEELNTLQRWGQAVTAWRNYQNVDVIRMQVINLRTWAVYSRELVLSEPEDVAQLELWEGRIVDYCAMAADMQPIANPGYWCLECPWAHRCKNVWMLTSNGDWFTHAEQLAAVETQRKVLIEAIKAQDPESPVPIPGGEVGYREQVTRAFQKGKERELLDTWLAATATEIPEDVIPTLTSLVAALAPGKSNLDAFAKALYPERSKGIRQLRDEFVDTLSYEVKQSRFGVWNVDKSDAKNDQGAT